MTRLANFFNGQFQPPTEGKYLDKTSPITKELEYQLPDSSEVDVVLAIRAAAKSYEAWSESSWEERARHLRRLADLIEANIDRVVRVLAEDVGMPVQFARTRELPHLTRILRHCAVAPVSGISVDLGNGGFGYEQRQPIGVVGLITPASAPLSALMAHLAPALACGNTVVCKPSRYASRSVALLLDLMQEAGVPSGVINVVFGRGETAGAFLVRHPGVPMIAFSGRTVTGQAIQRHAAEHTKRLRLALGGKNAIIVMKDADLAKAIPQVARACFANQGGLSVSCGKVLVQDDILKEFTEKFVAHVKTLKPGDPREEATVIGPVTSANHHAALTAAIELARSENGKLLTGEPTAEAAILPTVIGDLTNCSELHQTELLGPVVTLNGFKYAHDAVKWANNTPYGLAASVWTKSLAHAHKIAAGLRVGIVWINAWDTHDPRLLNAGGRTSAAGHLGPALDAFSQIKTVYVQP